MNALLRSTDPLLLTLLLLTDAAFIGIHVINRFLAQPYVLFFLNNDAGYPELYQYVKEFWIAVLLYLIYRRIRAGLYLAWSALFFYFLLDDSVGIHEKVGELAWHTFNYSSAFGLRAQDFGELTVSALAGLTLASWIGLSYRRASALAQSVAKDLCVLVALLIVFGVFVDMLDIILLSQPTLHLMGLSILEDGGEMLAMSLITAYSFQLYKTAAANPGLLWNACIHVGTRLFRGLS